MKLKDYQKNNFFDDVMIMLHKFDSNSKHSILTLQVIFGHFLKTFHKTCIWFWQRSSHMYGMT